MTDISTPRAQPSGPGQAGGPTVTERTKAVGQTAAQAGGDVAQATKEQGQQVMAEAGREARDLYGEVCSQVGDQVSMQQKRVTDGLYALRDEVTKMADQGGQSGPATQLARQASEKIDEAAQWLEGRKPGHLVEDVKSFARRNPGTFLAGAAVLGVLAGRLSKNLVGSSQNGGGEADSARPTGTCGPTATGSAPVPTPGLGAVPGTYGNVAPSTYAETDPFGNAAQGRPSRGAAS